MAPKRARESPPPVNGREGKSRMVRASASLHDLESETVARPAKVARVARSSASAAGLRAAVFEAELGTRATRGRASLPSSLPATSRGKDEDRRRASLPSTTRNAHANAGASTQSGAGSAAGTRRLRSGAEYILPEPSPEPETEAESETEQSATPPSAPATQQPRRLRSGAEYSLPEPESEPEPEPAAPSTRAPRRLRSGADYAVRERLSEPEADTESEEDESEPAPGPKSKATPKSKSTPVDRHTSPARPTTRGSTQTANATETRTSTARSHGTATALRKTQSTQTPVPSKGLRKTPSMPATATSKRIGNRPKPSPSPEPEGEEDDDEADESEEMGEEHEGQDEEEHDEEPEPAGTLRRQTSGSQNADSATRSNTRPQSLIWPRTSPPMPAPVTTKGSRKTQSMPAAIAGTKRSTKRPVLERSPAPEAEEEEDGEAEEEEEEADSEEEEEEADDEEVDGQDEKMDEGEEEPSLPARSQTKRTSTTSSAAADTASSTRPQARASVLRKSVSTPVPLTPKSAIASPGMKTMSARSVRFEVDDGDADTITVASGSAIVGGGGSGSRRASGSTSGSGTQLRRAASEADLPPRQDAAKKPAMANKPTPGSPSARRVIPAPATPTPSGKDKGTGKPKELATSTGSGTPDIKRPADNSSMAVDVPAKPSLISQVSKILQPVTPSRPAPIPQPAPASQPAQSLAPPRLHSLASVCASTSTKGKGIDPRERPSAPPAPTTPSTPTRPAPGPKPLATTSTTRPTPTPTGATATASTGAAPHVAPAPTPQPPAVHRGPEDQQRVASLPPDYGPPTTAPSPAPLPAAAPTEPPRSLEPTRHEVQDMPETYTDASLLMSIDHRPLRSPEENQALETKMAAERAKRLADEHRKRELAADRAAAERAAAIRVTEREAETASKVGATPQEVQEVQTETPRDHQMEPTSTMELEAQQNIPDLETIPDYPLMYHTALAAHHAAARHYHQAFVPLDLELPTPGMRLEVSDMLVKPLHISVDGKRVPFKHDVHAGQTALRLLVLALDLLWSGIMKKGPTPLEFAAWCVEYATVGLKVVHAVSVIEQMKGTQRALFGIEINKKDLLIDLELIVGKAIGVCTKRGYLKPYRQTLELAMYQIHMAKGHISQALKLLKEALAATSLPEDQHHRHALHLALMGHYRDGSNFEFFLVAKQIQREAKAAGHDDLIKVILIARLGAHFHLRKWDNLGDTLDEAERVLGVPPDSTVMVPDDASGLTKTLIYHWAYFALLYAGRRGDKPRMKRMVKMVMGDSHCKSNSGTILKVRLPPARGRSGDSGKGTTLRIQTTPESTLERIGALAMLVANRVLFSTKDGCHAVNFACWIRDAELLAVEEDMWDPHFAPSLGLGDVLAQRQMLMTVRAESMMEHALALICRSAFEDADFLLSKIVETSRMFNLPAHHRAHMLLLYAHFTQCLGRPELAVRYLRAAKSMVSRASELDVLIDVSLLSVQGKLTGLRGHAADPETVARVNRLADICRNGSNEELHAIGNLLCSLTHGSRDERTALAASYDAIRKCDSNFLHALIFAFTTAAHLYRDARKACMQLETGARLAAQLGANKAGEVGHATLGLWYAANLKEYYRLEGLFGEVETQQRNMDAHIRRAWEIRKFSLERFPLDDAAKQEAAYALACRRIAAYSDGNGGAHKQKKRWLTNADNTEGDRFRRWTSTRAENLRRWLVE